MSNNYKAGDKDSRPWGTWEVLAVGENYCVKRITVKEGGILSLQSHNFREENWLIASGEAVVTLDDEKFVRKVGESIYIPVKAKHRIQNDSDKPLVFIELQTGEKLDETDIIRYEDKYGR
ncbi:MAG: phosphomannose isomerase type II C-terminal cupin domain [Alphaproteobacteria bacterium]|nr:phosphomannose isomerase type II C-terminal cupin domain [Alphaproteobacteria bacterium]